MAEKLYKDGDKYALWSTLSDEFTAWDLDEGEVLAHCVEQAVKSAVARSSGMILSASAPSGTRAAVLEAIKHHYSVFCGEVDALRALGGLEAGE